MKNILKRTTKIIRYHLKSLIDDNIFTASTSKSQDVSNLSTYYANLNDDFIIPIFFLINLCMRQGVA